MCYAQFDTKSMHTYMYVSRHIVDIVIILMADITHDKIYLSIYVHIHTYVHQNKNTL